MFVNDSQVCLHCIAFTFVAFAAVKRILTTCKTVLCVPHENVLNCNCLLLVLCKEGQSLVVLFEAGLV